MVLPRTAWNTNLFLLSLRPSSSGFFPSLFCSSLAGISSRILGNIFKIWAGLFALIALMLPLPTHALNAVSQAECLVQATLGSLPVGQIYLCSSSGLRGSEFSPLLAREVISCCTRAARVSTPGRFSGIFSPLCQPKNQWQESQPWLRCLFSICSSAGAFGTRVSLNPSRKIRKG